MTVGDVTVSIAIRAARTLVELRVVVFKTTIGSLSKDDVDGSENVSWKCNFTFLQLFLNYSKSLRLQIVLYPGIKFEQALQRWDKIETFVIICSRGPHNAKQVISRHGKNENVCEM